jgi:hypothetical protein
MVLFLAVGLEQLNLGFEYVSHATFMMDVSA